MWNIHGQSNAGGEWRFVKSASPPCPTDQDHQNTNKRRGAGREGRDQLQKATRSLGQLVCDMVCVGPKPETVNIAAALMIPWDHHPSKNGKICKWTCLAAAGNRTGNKTGKCAFHSSTSSGHWQPGRAFKSRLCTCDWVVM